MSTACCSFGVQGEMKSDSKERATAKAGETRRESTSNVKNKRFNPSPVRKNFPLNSESLTHGFPSREKEERKGKVGKKAGEVWLSPK